MGTAAVIAPVGKFGYKGKDYVVNNSDVGPVALRSVSVADRSAVWPQRPIHLDGP